MCKKLVAANGVLVSLGDDGDLRDRFAQEHGCGSLAEVASEERRHSPRFGMPDSAFFIERRDDILERRKARVARRSNG